MLVAAPLRSTSVDFARRKRRPTEATDGETAGPASEIYIVARGTDPEVSDLIVAAQGLPDAAAAQSRTRTRRIVARPSLSVSATTESQQWRRTSWHPNVLAFHRRLDASASVIEIGTVTTIALVARAEMTTVTMSESAGIATMIAKDYIVAALNEVRMMSSPMEMNAHQVLDDAALMTKMTTLVEIPETPRYDDILP